MAGTDDKVADIDPLLSLFPAGRADSHNFQGRLGLRPLANILDTQPVQTSFNRHKVPCFERRKFDIFGWRDEKDDRYLFAIYCFRYRKGTRCGVPTSKDGGCFDFKIWAFVVFGIISKPLFASVSHGGSFVRFCLVLLFDTIHSGFGVHVLSQIGAATSKHMIKSHNGHGSRVSSAKRRPTYRARSARGL